MGRCGCSSVDTCGCRFSASGGLTASGLGSLANPIVIEPEATRRLIIVCTSSSRPGAPAVGQMIYETDTGLVYVWNGSAWKALSLSAQEDAASSTTLTAAVTDFQAVCSVVLGAGTWAINAKANLEASIDSGTGWDARLHDGGTELDRTSTAVSGGEHAGAGAETHWRPFSLQDLAVFSSTKVVTFGVRRATTNGTQTVRNAKLMAVRVSN